MNNQESNQPNQDNNSANGATEQMNDKGLEATAVAKQVASEVQQQEVEISEDAENQADDSQANEGTEVEQLRAKLAQADLETKRALAALQNATRHYEKQQLATYSRATASLLNQMLPAIDSLNMAMVSLTQTLGEDNEVLKGIALTVKLFDGVLDKIDAKPLAVVGDTLDPQMHQVISMIESDGEENKILQVLEQGWQIKQQMVRQALVVVSKKPANSDAQTKSEN